MADEHYNFHMQCTSPIVDQMTVDRLQNVTTHFTVGFCACLHLRCLRTKLLEARLYIEHSQCMVPHCSIAVAVQFGIKITLISL